jgi:hypothetical protein
MHTTVNSKYTIENMVLPDTIELSTCPLPRLAAAGKRLKRWR